jgi:hypothetical protein
MTRFGAPRGVAEDERGIALALALLAMVVIGALVAGTVYIGRLEMTAGRNTVASLKAAEVAEAGLTDAFLNWDTNWNSLTSLETAVAGPTTPSGVAGVHYSQKVTRLGGNLFMVEATGERVGPTGLVLASRKLGRLARLVTPEFEIEAAVTAKGNVTVAGNTTIDGNDHIPPGWGGACAIKAPKAGIRSSGTVNTLGLPTIVGAPPMNQNDGTVVDSIFQQPFDELLPFATITIPAGASWNGMEPTTMGSPARCDKSNALNWGEPLRGGGSVPECASYFPVIYSSGDVKVQAGRGQGIMLIAGDLEIRGNFEFDGIILVLGEVKTTGTGNKITGAVLSKNAQIGDVTGFGGNPTARYSSCAIENALRHASNGIPLARRSWAQRWQ